MRIKHTNIYTYAELSDDAKAKARDWYREASAGDDFFAESVTEDFKEAAKACGLELSGRNPNNRGDKGIYWSGFSSQGDGASFTASWSAARVDVAAILKDRPATYTDRNGVQQTCEGNAKLAPILEGFAELADLDREAYGSTVAGRGHYQTDTDYNSEHVTHSDVADERAATLKELCSDLAHWFYRTLEREYEYQNSDAAVAEAITCNEYEFTADGESA